MNVYVIDLDLVEEDEPSFWPDATDEEFITEAKRQETVVYRAKEFEAALNYDTVNVDNCYFRFINE